ncbi:MAG TPA: hypothetical protein VHT05_06835 [Candidatus Elarobacter sp.]|nr:hypothetical protein [Candidatus Elarobacter sp.]
MVTAFGELERRLPNGGTVLVDVRDLQLLGEAEMDGLVRSIVQARTEGRDVRLDARNLQWKRVVKKNLSRQPSVDTKLRSSARRTVILAHSPLRKRR